MNIMKHITQRKRQLQSRIIEWVNLNAPEIFVSLMS
jgi:hypothetical protein